MSVQMKIRKNPKFVTTHQSRKIWNILIGISIEEQQIKHNSKPFQYIHVWNSGFIDEKIKNQHTILYRGVLTNRNQKVYINVVNYIELTDNTKQNLYLFNKNAGNDIWECLYFSKEFQEYKNKYIQTNDCKIQMKNIFYALIGSIIN